jgi:hypothetical protein
MEDRRDFYVRVTTLVTSVRPSTSHLRCLTLGRSDRSPRSRSKRPEGNADINTLASNLSDYFPHSGHLPAIPHLRCVQTAAAPATRARRFIECMAFSLWVNDTPRREAARIHGIWGIGHRRPAMAPVASPRRRLAPASGAPKMRRARSRVKRGHSLGLHEHDICGRLDLRRHDHFVRRQHGMVSASLGSKALSSKPERPALLGCRCCADCERRHCCRGCVADRDGTWL